MAAYVPEIERFWNKVQKTDTCWFWTGRICNLGYGQFDTHDRRSVKAHRYSFLIVKGQIEAGLELDHLCRNRNCVNPGHLEAVSHRENVLRGIGPCAIQAKKTACKYGHLFIPENTRIDKTREGNPTRRCRVCEILRGPKRGWKRTTRTEERLKFLLIRAAKQA